MRGQYFSWALLACLLVPAGAFAQSKVIVQSKITPAKVMVGQQAQLLVDVYFLGTMTHPPSVDMPDIDGAQLFRFESQGIYISTTIGGNNYTGKEFEFDIYPRRSGNFQIPPATITLLDANGNPAGNMNGTAQTLIAQTPPGFSASTPIIASPNVTMGEKFTPSTPKLAVGDSVTRIITRHADAVPALSFSDISQPAIPGAQIYQAAPDIEDLIDHGDVTGKRVDKTTFVLERAGTFAIPKYTQTWWNTDMNQAETIEVPGFSATILPSAASSNATILPAAAYLSATLVAILAIAGAVLRHLKRRAVPPARSISPRMALRMLSNACQQADAVSAYKALRIWLSFQPLTAPDPTLAASIAVLEAAVFGNTPWTDGAALKLRQDIQHARPARSHTRTEKLPDLNPV